MTSSTIKGGAGADLVIASGLIALVSFMETAATIPSVVGAVTSTSAYGGVGNDSVTIGGAGATLSYEGGLGDDTIKLVVLSTAPHFMATIHRQLKVVPTPLVAQLPVLTPANSGDDSVHLVGNVTASTVYLNTGDDSVSINAGLIASTIYGGEGKDSVYIVNGASTAALIDGGTGNDS